MNHFWLALGLTAFAGLSTGIGSVIAFFAKRTNFRFLSVATGFSAGVMLYISFAEIFPEGLEFLEKRFSASMANWINVAAFFGGILFIAVIDAFVPAATNPHEVHTEKELKPLHDPTAPPPPEVAEKASSDHHDPALMRTGVFTAIAIALHNFPEGIVTFLAALYDPALGVAIAIAIALHNIPEGISVSVPIYYATGKRSKAFLYSFLSGLAEPAGALIAYAILRLVFADGNGQVFPPHIMGIMFAGVAGIMVYISLDELLPTSRAYGKGHDSLLGLVSGMFIMALSLLLLD